jgi:hypothetical protein
MPTFSEFVAAYNTFGNDATYSGGSTVHLMTPWESPWKWQDNLTFLPEGITEEQVKMHLELTDTILVSCTDKDMIHDVWEMQVMGGVRKVWMIAAAGGVVQPEGERAEAMKTIAAWLAEQAFAGTMPMLGCVAIMSHNESCGAIRQWNDNISLLDLAHKVVDKDVLIRDYEENTLVSALIRRGAKAWEPFRMIDGIMYNVGLFDLQRDGKGNKPKIRPLTSDGDMLTVDELKNTEKVSAILT